MRKTSIAILLAGMSLCAVAQTETAPKTPAPSLSGYVIGRYQADFKEGGESNSFDIRMIRVSLSGHIAGDFEYRVQGQINGNTATLGSSPRIVDAYAEWQRYKYCRVKAGQFKRPFTFENPMHPIDQGFMGYGQVVNKLAGFSDRTGEQPSNGRDIGVQLQGDIMPNSTGRYLLHYQVGLFNGQGINTSDTDNRKDIIGGIWAAPVDGLRIGVFGWSGSHARKGTVADETGNAVPATVSLSQYRYALSAEYRKEDWQIRSEYIHSTGYGFSKTYQREEDKSDITVNKALGNKADGFYALCIAPVISGRLRAKARYDLYRRTARWSDSRTQYEVGLNWLIHKNVEIQTEYALINDRSMTKSNYSMANIELCVRF